MQNFILIALLPLVWAMVLALLTITLIALKKDPHGKIMPSFWMRITLLLGPVFLAPWYALLSGEIGLGYLLGIFSCGTQAAAFLGVRWIQRKKKQPL